MLDYGKRLLIAVIIGLCVGLLIIGGKSGHAQEKREQAFSGSNWTRSIWMHDAWS
ncbi:hypothetical protein SAMN05443252_103409 [Bacillus sp. OV322]|uniref:hypothetical protein n=1 Tax=Bacillus sp. OV322 TaxID=1882764 RepID=UPI0008E69199|nr:hypothetical protein [Bacillus sp. OV322]SFC44084.1 hypothetical protein SAMN05443252_103409 [Bacillus sp. OV322]